MTTKSLTINENPLLPVPVNVTVDLVTSQSSLNAHIDADATILTANLIMLMQTFPNLSTLSEICELSDQVMKVLTKRRELCLKPTSKQDIDSSEIDITPAS